MQLHKRPTRTAWICLAFALAGTATADAAPRQPTAIASIELSKPFDTRSPWRFSAVQGPPVEDPIIGVVTGDTLPGDIAVCISKGSPGQCDSSLQTSLRPPSPHDFFSTPHFLGAAQILRPRGATGRPLLLVRMASIYSGDGDQLVRTQVLAYQHSSDSFVRIYDLTTGHNNNQEVRYIPSGVLKGDIISVEPTEHAPFVFWITVNALSSDYTYHEILRNRSATHYGDGNSLAVIDSEMPNIQERLGLWHLGAPLPVPAGPCPKPRLSRMELWCK